MSVDRLRRRVFVDSNIWLYALVGGQETEKSWRAFAATREIHPVVNDQVVNEVCVNLLKKFHFEEPAIRQVISGFHRGCTILPLSERTLRSASELRERYSLSYWDSTIVASAIESGVELLWTEDLQHGLVVDRRLTIENPLLDR